MSPFPNAPSLIQPTLLSRMNERQVLRAIQAHGPMSRAEVARYAGISAPTASKSVESLLRAGWLEEGDAPELVRGRPAKKLHLPGQTAQVLGLVIDADQCRVVSAGLDGNLHDGILYFPTPDSYEALLDQAVCLAEKLMQKPDVRTLGMGISVPGLIDYGHQRGILSPNVPATNNHSPAYDLQERLDIQCIIVQESHALCLAERYYGNARGLDNFAMLDATSGVGLGVMSGGQLLTGNRGFAGEVGHITVVADGRQCGCGNFGCLETVACDSALAWSVSRLTGHRVSMLEVVQMLENRSGNAASVPPEALRMMTEYLAVGVAAVINLFNPSNLFIHSKVLRASDTLFEEMIAAAEKRALPPSFADCHIVQAQGSKRQGAIAGIIEHLLNALVPSALNDSHYLSGNVKSSGYDTAVVTDSEKLRVKEAAVS